MANVPESNVGEENVKHIPVNPQLPTDAGHHTCTHAMNENARNLIVCIDGTSNQFGEQNTNVIELYNLILKGLDDNQQTWYNSGIGTYAQPSFRSPKYLKQVLYHKVDLAIAWDFERTILGAYRWLSDNYLPGDRIFLFGFSRGAFQVRVLSAMIDKVGLILKGNEMQIPFAFALYADPKSGERKAPQVGSDPDEKPITMAERFKTVFSHKDVRVHFVGAWDTVSSIGVARGKCMLPGTVDGMKHVCHFRHALALDERRVKFLPEYAYGGRATEGVPVANGKETTQEEDTQKKDAVEINGPKSKAVHTKEVWFAGTHSDIGGGNVENSRLDRSRPPLRWMVFEAGGLGLRTGPFSRPLSSKNQIEVKESLTWQWRLFEALPFTRLTFTGRAGSNGTESTIWPHFGSSRKIHEGQKIHSSLMLADEKHDSYTPKARPVKRSTAKDSSAFWHEMRHEGKHEDQLEFDLYELTTAALEILIHEGDDTAIRRIATWRDGRQAVYDKVIEMLNDTALEMPKSPKRSVEEKFRLIRYATAILKGGLPLRLLSLRDVLPLLSDLSEGNKDDYKKAAAEFIVCLTNPQITQLEDGTAINTHIYVAYSPDGSRIASSSGDCTIRIWDSQTGVQVGDPLRGHTNTIRSITYSPDGKHVASGSDDRTVRIWDAEMGTQVGRPLQGHTDCIKAIAYSPDGTHITSGSCDGTLRIWNTEKGAQVGDPLRGHTDYIRSVGYSPDGRRVVSGSDDRTIRIWDVKKGVQVGEPLRGPTSAIWTAAYSPDGKRVASGSGDCTVRIWDAETGAQVGEPLQGHTFYVWDVAFSPDGRRLASASGDNTIRVWDPATGRQIGEPLRGHKGFVYSVMFSSDGKRLVSGSLDGTVRIWDVEAFGAAGL